MASAVSLRSFADEASTKRAAQPTLAQQAPGP